MQFIPTIHNIWRHFNALFIRASRPGHRSAEAFFVEHAAILLSDAFSRRDACTLDEAAGLPYNIELESIIFYNAEFGFGESPKKYGKRRRYDMIKSMTGFGRCEITENNRKIMVEMKSVNHRYLDVNIKMPKKLNFFEAAIRNELKNYVQRGKIDMFITYEDFTEANICVKYNKELAAEYKKYLEQMAEDFSLDNDIRVSALSRYPEVLSMEEQTVDEEELWQLLRRAIRSAAEGFVAARVKEGENLRDDLIAKLDGMLEHLHYITVRSPKIIAQYRQNLEDKVKELLEDAQIDDSRLLMEVTIFADKVCVDEELVRLQSHIETTRENLLQGGSIGRKLDFIAQEMNREANTILSKTTDLEISNHAIELKTEIEKVREQIQNIE